MSVVLVVLSAVAMMALPPRGVALETKAGVELQSLSGSRSGFSAASISRPMDVGRLALLLLVGRAGVD